MVSMLSRSQWYLCNRSLPGKVIFKLGCCTCIAFVRTNIDSSKIMTNLSMLEVYKLCYIFDFDFSNKRTFHKTVHRNYLFVFITFNECNNF